MSIPANEVLLEGDLFGRDQMTTEIGVFDQKEKLMERRVAEAQAVLDERCQALQDQVKMRLSSCKRKLSATVLAKASFLLCQGYCASKDVDQIDFAVDMFDFLEYTRKLVNYAEVRLIYTFDAYFLYTYSSYKPFLHFRIDPCRNL